ncbi:MAG TPA: tetratricopeptide repeat protein [Rhodothermales bacterium]|nr:tetratricopeptide repeat protein [Rhodothermales bacterium]
MRRGSFLLLTLLLLAGCSSSSFIGRRLDNFTARYNAFYNAEKAFKKGVDALVQSDAAIDRTVYLMVFPVPERAATTQEFNSTIKKSADVLRRHPSSKWVDNALMLIGEAYFYQRNFIGAEQKFREVMSLSSPLGDEARFWLARTLIASGSYEPAAEHLAESLARDDLSERWKPMLYLAQGQLFVRQGDWEGAADALTQGLHGVRDDKLRARSQFLLGQVYETLGRYDDAVHAFEYVEHYHPLYELSYAAQLSAARVAGLHGHSTEALQVLRRMERDDKHFTKRPEIAFVRGQVLEASERPYDALATYRGILYGDTENNVQSVRGRIQYAMAELYRDALQDFVTASAHFDTAATLVGAATAVQTAGSGPASLAYTSEAITDSRREAQVFHSFAAAVGEVARMDSLLRLGAMDDESFQSFILDLRKQLAREQAAQQKELQRRQAERGFSNAAVDDANRPQSGGTASTAGESSFLFNQEPARVQEGKMLFIQRWGDRPLVPNWRREAAIIAVAEAAARGDSGAIAQTTIARTATEADLTLPPVDISAVPRTPEAREEMLQERAEGRYEVGNVLFLSMNRPDSAAAWYRMVIEQDGDQPVARRAYYALAEVDRALGDTASANRLYRQILDQYPETDFANLVRERLGLEHQELVGPDTLARAEAAYADAYAEWKAGRHRESIRDMFALAAAYPETPVAPRALYAAASAYTELARQDSLDLLGDLRISLSDSLLRAAGVAVKDPTPRTAVNPDSLIAPAEVRQALFDSLALADSLAHDDSLAARPGSVAEDPVLVPVSQVSPQEHPEPMAAVQLDAIYSAITQHYGKSPYADPSKRMLETLSTRRNERAAADSAAMHVARKAAAAGGTRADSSAGATLRTNTASPADSLQQASAPASQQEQPGGLEAEAKPAADSTQAPAHTAAQLQLESERERKLEMRREQARQAAAADSTAAGKRDTPAPRDRLLEP